MKSRGTIFIVVLLLLSIISSTPLSFGFDSFGFVYVDDDQIPGWYDATHVHTIEEAITNASSGDTIYIYNGTYAIDDIVIQKSLTINGEHESEVLVDCLQGGEGTSTGIFIDTDLVNISNMTFYNASGSIPILSASLLFLFNNYIRIENCTFIGGEPAIRTVSGNSSILYCTFVGTSVELGIKDFGPGLPAHVDNCVISNNTFKDSPDGGLWMVISNTEVSYNIFDNLSSFNSNMYALINEEESGGNNVIHHNLFLNNAGGRNIRDNSVVNNTCYNTSTEGNYYYNYKTIYTEAIEIDGVWSIPYEVNGTANSIDYYPLVHHFVNTPPIFSNENPQNGIPDVNPLPKLSIQVDDYEGGEVDVTWWWRNDFGEWFQFASNLSVAIGENPVTIVQTNSNFSEYDQGCIWSVNATDGIEWTNETYIFFTRNQYVPTPPSNFVATGTTLSKINVSWTKGTNASSTYICYQSGVVPPASRNEGIFVYNGTGTYVEVSGLQRGKTYSFSAWSWNETDNVWGTLTSDDGTTKGNNRVVISNEHPFNEQPIISISLSQLSVDIADQDSDLMSWSIEAYRIGTNISIGSSSGVAEGNGTKTCSISGLMYDETYLWYVNVTDGYVWTREIFTFTVMSYPDVYVDDDAHPGWYDAMHVKTIAEAITNASSGDTIFVHNGFYITNKCSIGKQVILVGENKESTIIDNDFSGEPNYIFEFRNLASSYSVVTGFTLTHTENTSALISVGDFYGASVTEDVEIFDNNFFRTSEYGRSWLPSAIRIVRAKGTIIRHNIIKDTYYAGIYLEDVFPGTIIDGNIINCGQAHPTQGGGRYAIRLEDAIGSYQPYSWRAEIKNNIMTIANHSAYSYGSLYINRCSDLYIHNNTIVVQNVTDGFGIKILNFAHHPIICRENIAIENNSISGGDGIQVYYGIYIEGLWTGEVLFENISIFKNSISGTNYGIKAESCENSTIYGNRIIHSNWYNIHLTNCSGNLLYGNIMEEAAVNAWDDTLGNRWNETYPIGGNYYLSDYLGCDEFSGPNQDIPGKDGFGDSPKIIVGGADNRDYYPFQSRPLDADFVYVPDYPVTTDTITFIAESGIFSGNPVSWSWNFGDGNTDNGRIVSHNYPISDEYLVTLTITDALGYSDSTSKIIPVCDSPEADFVFSPSEPSTNQQIFFEDTSKGCISAWSWNFGDARSTNQNELHSFTTQGYHAVTLTVRDLGGNEDSIIQTIYVSGGAGSGVGGGGGVDEIHIPPVQPPKYPTQPYTVPEMYQLLNADINSDAALTIVTIDSGNIPQTYQGIDLSKITELFHPIYQNARDTYGHGTWVNYAIAYGVQTFCPNAEHYTIRAFDRTGGCTLSTFLQSLEMAENLYPDVISISAGVQGTPSDALSQAINRLRNKGIIVIVSAGNEGPTASSITSPALASGALAIGAIDPMRTFGDFTDDQVTLWSSRGPIAGISPKPDFASPGESIIGPWLSGTKVASGTSMAAPFIAAGALQIMSANKAGLDTVSIFLGKAEVANMVEQAIIDSCYDKGDENAYGWGIPNFERASSSLSLAISFRLGTSIFWLVLLVIIVLLIARELYKKTKK